MADLHYTRFPTTVSVQTLEMASQAAYGSDPSSFGLTAMTGSDGAPLAISTADGCTADAYRDAAGNVIIAFQGTSSASQQALDGAFLTGSTVASLPGFAEAAAFVRTVKAQAAADGIPASRLYVTGHSLGGTLAEYASLQTGVAGASFAGSGLTGYASPGTASNFVSFVERGDPFANFATDAAEKSFVGQMTAEDDHYGEVVQVGTGADAATLTSFIAAAEASGAYDPAQPISAMYAAPTQLGAAMEDHALPVYDSAITAQFGSGATLAQVAALEAGRMSPIVGAPIRPPAVLDVAGSAGSGVSAAALSAELAGLHALAKGLAAIVGSFHLA